MSVRSICVASVVAVCLALPVAPVAAVVRPCSNGNVALTFDDGPRPPYTDRILDTLKAKRAPATFFVVGMVADRQPALMRRMHAEGHRIANHSWSHPELWSLSPASVRSQLVRTNQEIRSQGLPVPTVMRPPYAATNSRVRSVVADMGMAHVLWSIDTSDWKPGRSALSIKHAALSQLHHRGNILMHDGVANSGATAAALPGLIDGIRARGYCIGALNDAGRVVSATPKVRISDAQVREGGAGTRTKLLFRISLSVPTSRKVTVAWETSGRGAAAGRDYASRGGTAVFAPGSTVVNVTVPVFGDRLDERHERVVVRLSNAAAATIARRTGRGAILDDDAVSRLSIRDAVAVESVSPAAIRIELNRPSGKRISVAYRTIDRSAQAGKHYRSTRGTLAFAPGQTRKTVAVPLIDRTSTNDGTSTFVLVGHSAVNAVVKRAAGVVSLADDPLPSLAAPDVTVREDVAGGRANVIVTLSRATSRTVTVGFATRDGTAKSGSDYVAGNGTLTFAAGTRSRTISVPIIDNLVPSARRQFNLVVSRSESSPVNAVLLSKPVIVTITDDDALELP